MCKYCKSDNDPLCERCKQPYFTDGTKCLKVEKKVGVNDPKPTRTYFIASNSDDIKYEPMAESDYTAYKSTPENPLKHLQ